MEFKNTAKNLTITLEYGLCTIVRPWLLGNIFYLDNWYMEGEKKHSVSNGKLDPAGQLGSMLPMLPTQFLVIRNVKIESTDWGSDGTTLDTYFEGADDHGEFGWSSTGGGVSVAIGPLTLGGGGSYTKTNARGSNASFNDSSQARDYGATWDGEKLEIKGSQVVGWLSTITPASAPLDDPAS